MEKQKKTVWIESPIVDKESQDGYFVATVRVGVNIYGDKLEAESTPYCACMIDVRIQRGRGFGAKPDNRGVVDFLAPYSIGVRSGSQWTVAEFAIGAPVMRKIEDGLRKVATEHGAAGSACDVLRRVASILGQKRGYQVGRGYGWNTKLVGVDSLVYDLQKLEGAWEEAQTRRLIPSDAVTAS